MLLGQSDLKRRAWCARRGLATEPTTALAGCTFARYGIRHPSIVADRQDRVPAFSE